MSSNNAYIELDEAIDAVLHDGIGAARVAEPALAELVDIAGELRKLPEPEFFARLEAELVHEGYVARPSQARAMPQRREQPVPPTLLATFETYPVQRGNFALSFALHAVVLAMLASSTYWISTRPEVKKNVGELVTDISPYVLPAAPRPAGGGGGGGDRDTIAASHGAPPRFSNQQLTPPAVVLRNTDPLAAEPTVVGSANVTFPPLPLGDPMANLGGPPSNGTGSGGGMGDGSGGGVGSGRGPGVGPGEGGGIGGGIYRVGGGVSAPRGIYTPDPQFSEEARKAKHQGTVLLTVIIGPDGRPHDIKIARSLGMGLDQQAIQAVRTWKFEPAKKNGVPVAVIVSIEVNFRLY